jgi:hypothetical protein
MFNLPNPDFTVDVGNIHVGDIGTIFLATIIDQDGNVVDLSSASSLKIIFQNPSRTGKSVTALLYSDGTDGKIYYVLQDKDIDESGVWSYQGVIVIGSDTWHSSVVQFTVMANLS